MVTEAPPDGRDQSPQDRPTALAEENEARKSLFSVVREGILEVFPNFKGGEFRDALDGRVFTVDPRGFESDEMVRSLSITEHGVDKPETYFASEKAGIRLMAATHEKEGAKVSTGTQAVKEAEELLRRLISFTRQEQQEVTGQVTELVAMATASGESGREWNFDYKYDPLAWDGS